MDNPDVILWSQTVTLVGDTPVPGSTPANAILVDSAGTVTFRYANGKLDTLYLAAGMWHKMNFDALVAGGTATGIHVGYMKK